MDEVIEAARARFDVSVREIMITQEDVHFKIPKVLRDTEEVQQSA